MWKWFLSVAGFKVVLYRLWLKGSSEWLWEVMCERVSPEWKVTGDILGDCAEVNDILVEKLLYVAKKERKSNWTMRVPKKKSNESYLQWSSSFITLFVYYGISVIILVFYLEKKGMSENEWTKNSTVLKMCLPHSD